MSIDLNGSATGFDYATTYREEDPAIQIVATHVRVGTGSSSANTDAITLIRVTLDDVRPGDQWQLSALPANIFARTTPGGQPLTFPASMDAFANPWIYLSSNNTTDAGWQEALKAIRFFNAETTAGTRTIAFEATNSFGVPLPKVATSIEVIPLYDPAVAVADLGTAVEAGGVANTTPGSDAWGNVLVNDVHNELGPLTVSMVAHGGTSVLAGGPLNGAYGTLTLLQNGQYTYVVNNTHPTVQGLRNAQALLTDTFSYTLIDADDNLSTTTLTITIQGQDDTPFDVAVGQHFDGTAASVVAGAQPLGVDRDFTFELRVSPSQTIELKTQNLYGVAGFSYQHYAVSPLHGYSNWGSNNHAGVGLSVGTNGISVYQHSSNLLSPLLTWHGSVTANTHVAVVFNDNQPSLYVNGVLVATGLQSNRELHPPTELGGIGWGYFDGSVADFIVWNEALTAAGVSSRSIDSTIPASAAPALVMAHAGVPENAPEGMVVTTVRARDVDNSDPLTYALTNDAGGRFQIDATSGEVRVAPGAVFDHETAAAHTLTVQVSDLAGQSVQRNLTVAIGNVNEAPQLAQDAITVSSGLLSMTVDQDHGLWWVDLLSGQRSFIATAGAPKGFVLHPESGGLPTVYKAISIQIKQTGTVLSDASNVAPNLSYQLADWGTAAAGIVSAWLWSYQHTRYADYMVARNSVAAVGGALLGSGDLGGSGILAYLWSQVRGTLYYDNYLYNTGSEGGRFVAAGQGILGFGLVGTDLLATIGLYAAYGEASGIGWGGVADAAWAFGAVTWSTLALNYGYSAFTALAPTWFKFDLSSLQNALKISPAMEEAKQEGRTVEYNLMWRPWLMDTIRATPVVNWFGGVAGLAEIGIVRGVTGEATVEQFQQAVQQRLQAQDDHPHEGTMARSQLVLQHALKIGTADHTFDISNSIDDFSFALNSNVKVMKSVVVSEIVDGVADTSPKVLFLSEAQTIGVAGGNNLTGQHVIEVERANTTGKLATYVIRPDATMTLTDIGLEVQGPLMLIDASGSTVDSTNQFFVYNPNVAIHGGQGEDVYLLAESLRPQVSIVDGTKLVAGYIQDGIVSAGRDSTSRPAVRCWWVVPTHASSIRSSCAVPSAACRRTRFSSTAPCARTSPMAARPPTTLRCWKPRARRVPPGAGKHLATRAWPRRAGRRARRPPSPRHAGSSPGSCPQSHRLGRALPHAQPDAQGQLDPV